MDLPNLVRIEHEEVPSDAHIPRVLPASWRRKDDMVNGGQPGGAVFQSGSLLVLLSESVDSKSGKWIHLSMSYPGSPPSWSQIMECRRVFFGDREAVMIVPRDHDEVDLSREVRVDRSPWHIWTRPW
jgi:hypothetical protein